MFSSSGVYTLNFDSTKLGKLHYTEEFRRAAVDLVAAERLTVAEAARRLGVHPEVLRKWKRRYVPAAGAAAGAAPTAPDLAAENRRLREQVRQLAMDRDILKKLGRQT